MEDVERVLRVLLQAADVTRAEFLQVKRGSHLAMHAAKVDREAEVDEDPDVIVTREVELAEAVVRENRVDHRAKVEVVLLPFVAPAYLPKDGEEVRRFVWVLAVYREVCGALELVLARRPAVGRERFYARERDRLPVDDSIHPRHLVEPLVKPGAAWHEARVARNADGPAVHAECRLDQPFLPNAGVEAVRAGSTAALEVGVAHRVEVPVLVDTEVVVGHFEREHRR